MKSTGSSDKTDLPSKCSMWPDCQCDVGECAADELISRISEHKAVLIVFGIVVGFALFFGGVALLVSRGI